MRNWLLSFSMVFAVVSLGGCGYNTFQTTDEQIKAGWAEVLNQYQRRADLVPNLVNVVKGYAAHEKEVLDRKSTRLNSSHLKLSRMPSSA